MDANMDELLDLCTGKFTSQGEKPLPRKNDKKENMEELLDLCSGKFTSQGKYQPREHQAHHSQISYVSILEKKAPYSQV